MLNDLDPEAYPHIYIRAGFTDLRKGIDGLAALITSEFALDPFDGSLFLFCGRRTDRIKALCYEGDGFVLLYKRLACGRFRWPRNGEELESITADQYAALMKGWEISPSIKEFRPIAV